MTVEGRGMVQFFIEKVPRYRPKEQADSLCLIWCNSAVVDLTD